jgi:magnesium transporter
MTVGEAFKRIRRTGVDKETIYTCYITEEDRNLIGMISIRTLLLNDEESVLADIMEQNVISVTTMEDQESVAQMFSKYNFMALPVVDTENRLVGIVTIDDAMDVMQEEATEDFEKMAGITPIDKPYLRASVTETFLARAPWLLILMLSATFTGIIITTFEKSLSAFVILTAFIPMLCGTGGNSGTQSSTAVIRSLSLGEIHLNNWLEVIWKEIRVAVLCGVVLATCNFAKLLLVDGFLMQNPSITPIVALVISLTLVFTVLCAKTVGCMLPMVATRIGFDPAVMATPFISTIVDTVSLLIYFQIARVILHI